MAVFERNFRNSPSSASTSSTQAKSASRNYNHNNDDSVYDSNTNNKCASSIRGSQVKLYRHDDKSLIDNHRTSKLKQELEHQVHLGFTHNVSDNSSTTTANFKNTTQNLTRDRDYGFGLGRGISARNSMLDSGAM